MKMKTTTKPKKEKKLLLRLMDGERQRHSVALVTEEGEWNQHEPNSSIARMFVVMLLVHVVLIGGIIIYDFMGDEEVPKQSATQAARAMGGVPASGLPQASPEVVREQAQAAADTEQFDNYEMRSGDSLKSIASKFSTTEEEITKLNMIDKGLQIGPGTMLRVPKQAVPSAIPVDPNTLRPMAEKAIPVQDQPTVTKEPSEAVKPSDAPASLSAAMTPMSLTAPNEALSVGGALTAANTPATTPAPPQNVPVLPPPAKPNVVSLLKESAPAARDSDKEPAKQAAKSEPKPLLRPSPVPPPTQMLKKIADSPPATKTETSKKSADTPPPASKKAEKTKKTAETSRPAAAAKSSQAHVLKGGETLYRLSVKYGVSVSAIQKANNIKNPNALREGMKLVIPAR